jgi:ABC-type amino acid transport substrate-binding protein
LREVRLTRILLVVIASLVLGLAAVGCGDDDDDDDGGGGATDTTAADFELLREGTLTVASDIPFPPFEQGDPPDYEGFDIDLINEVADRLELETEIKDLPFDVLLQGAGSGRYDVAIAATTIQPARERKVDFSDPYFNAEQSLLVQADGDIRSIDDITADSIIGAQDATTGETYANENTEADVRPFQEIDDAYQALENGQVDAVMNDLPSTESVAEDNPDLEVVQTFDTREEYGIIFAEGQDALREQINEALQEIKDDGTLNDLYQTWFEKDAPASLLEATHEPE